MPAAVLTAIDQVNLAKVKQETLRFRLIRASSRNDSSHRSIGTVEERYVSEDLKSLSIHKGSGDPMEFSL